MNNGRSTFATLESAVNLFKPISTSEGLKKMGQNRREYTSKFCLCFVSDYLMQLDNFLAKGASGRKIRVGEVVFIHNKHSKRLMRKTGVVKELLPSWDRLVWSAIVKFSNGNLLNRENILQNCERTNQKMWTAHRIRSQLKKLLQKFRSKNSANSTGRFCKLNLYHSLL